jgi:lambda family phage portal protein
MKLSIEIARSNAAAAGGITGAALRSPYPDEALRVRAQDIRDFQEFRSLAEKMNRSYDAASGDNFTADFKLTTGSANTEMLPGKYSVRARARTLAKDTPHGKALMRVYADNVVGDDPFELEMEVGSFQTDTGADGKKSTTFVEDDETNTAIETAWRRYIRSENFTVRQNMDFMQAMRIVEMSRAREGSVVCRLHPEYTFNEFGFAVDLLEEDRLQEQYMGISPQDGRFGGGNPIRASIEYHPKYNFALAYWLLNRHPGEFFGINQTWQDARGKSFREQVPATEIIHFNNLRNRAEQDIGMTELDATVLPLWRIHQYDKSLTLSSIASASKPWWIEEKMPTGQELPSEIRELVENYKLNGGGNAGLATPGSGTPVQTIKPGNREKLPAGMELKQADPKFPIEAAHEFRNDNLRDVSTGTFGSYQQLSGDYQNLGFIAGLMSQQAFQRNVRVRQKTLAEDLRTLFRAWLNATIKSGYFEKRGQDILMSRLEEYVDAHKFKGQQAEFVNPLVQAQALILLEEAHHMSRQDVQDALPNGKKVDKLFAQIAQEEKEAESAGVELNAIATEPGVNKEGQNPPGTDLPTKPGTEAGASGDIPPKSKVQSPRTSAVRRRGEIDATTLALIASSQNGDH